MFRHYLTSAFRTLFKYKFISFINLFILSLVIAVSLHLLRYISFEKSFDRFHKDYENIYRIHTKVNSSSDKVSFALAFNFTSELMRWNFPEVKGYTRLSPVPDDCTIEYDNQFFRENRIFLADSSFFSFFSFPLKVGDPTTVLQKGNAAVISESAVKKYFGNKNPLGEKIKVKGKYHTDLYEITGIYKDFPPNSHIQANIILSNKNLFNIPKHIYNYGASMHWNYISLEKGTDIENLIKKTNDKIEELQIYNRSEYEISLFPLKSIHLFSNDRVELEHMQGGYYKTIYLIGLICLICFSVAFINFINISVVKTLERTREVGIRKSIGAGFADNMKFFFSEAMLQIVIALVLSFLFYIITKKIISTYFEFVNSYSLVDDTRFFLLIVTGFISIAILTGLIYSYIFSHIGPTVALKGKKLLSNKINLRVLPILLQFIVCVVFISFTFIVLKQNNFIRNKDLGFEKENVVMLLQPHLEKFWEIEGLMQVFDKKVMTNPSIINVTRAVYNPACVGGYGIWGYVKNDRMEHNDSVMVAQNEVMYTYFDFYKMKVIAGQGFDVNSTDNQVVINESAVKMLQFQHPLDVINKEVYIYNKKMYKTVIGVIEDFNQESLRKKTEPVIFHLTKGNRHAVVIRIDPRQMKGAMEFLESTWMEIFPESEFAYEFLSDEISIQYKDENRFQKWLNFFCILLIIICCFGIMIITFYTYKEKEKEISIRKVLGADMYNLVGLSRVLLYLMVLSLVSGLVISYFISIHWLQNYAYQVNITIWFFLLPGIIMLFFFLTTVFYSVKKAIVKNPSESLKIE